MDIANEIWIDLQIVSVTRFSHGFVDLIFDIGGRFSGFFDIFCIGGPLYSVCLSCTTQPTNLIKNRNKFGASMSFSLASDYLM